MGVTFDRGGWYYVRRVPRHLAGLVTGRSGRAVTQVRLCLHTDSRREALAKAARVEAEITAEWAAIAAGHAADARAHYLAARALAEAKGFAYLPAARLAEADLAEIIARVRAAEGAPVAVADAVLGLVPEASPDLRAALAEYFTETESRVAMKAPAQLKRWRQRRIRAVEQFCAATQAPRPDGTFPAPEIARIGPAEVKAFRTWARARIAEGQAVDTQNKAIGALSDIWAVWAKGAGHRGDNPFRGVRLEGRDISTRAPYDRATLKDRVIPGLTTLNAEARDLFLVLVNTGIRPSEIINGPPGCLVLDHAVPHLDIAEARGRELKQAHTARKIPLLGVSLEAARRLAAAPDWLPRYHWRGDAFSAAVNKYLGENGLRPTPDHSVYSVRHGVEDALLEAGIDDRVRADILGQKYGRPRYGTGGALAGRAAALAAIAL